MPDSLAAALAQLQQQLPDVAKTQDAQIGPRAYKYADLADVSRELLPVMAKLGLVFTAAPTLSIGVFVLSYQLLHTSGESIAGEYPLPATGTPQQIGSAITYARRYALCAVTGLAPHGDDDDAQAAETAAAAKPRTDEARNAAGLMTRAQAREHKALRSHEPSRPAERHTGPLPDDQWTAGPAEDAPGSATLEQTRRLAIALSKIGITGDDRLITCSSMAGRDLKSSKDLSYTEAQKIITWAETEGEKP